MRSCGLRYVRIVSWLGGEHWYISNIKFMRLEEAIAYCKRWDLDWEVVRDPRQFAKHEED